MFGLTVLLFFGVMGFLYAGASVKTQAAKEICDVGYWVCLFLEIGSVLAMVII